MSYTQSIKNKIGAFIHTFGYGIMKVDKTQPYKETIPSDIYKSQSSDEKYNFYKTPIGNYYLPKDQFIKGYNSEKDMIAYSMKRGKCLCEELIPSFKKYLQQGMSVIDIGANYGQLSIFFAQSVGKTGKVYSFEANKNVYDVLVKNSLANEGGIIKPFYNAVYHKNNETLIFPDLDLSDEYTKEVGNAPGSYGFFKPKRQNDNQYKFEQVKSSEGTKVTTITIDSLNIQEPVCLMKVDVQGCDLFAMKGAVETIKKHKMPIFFEFEEFLQESFQTNFQSYVDFVREIDYHFAHKIATNDFLILPNI
ncbi:MAG: FkbM family methyltransferase [Phycisphaerales bacterium]|nr:FkbM family methyltransferase [Phycisphaerales bacterium]